MFEDYYTAQDRTIYNDVVISWHGKLFLFQSMIGHGLGAAGGLEAIATIKAITTGWVHPTINQDVLHLINLHFQILGSPLTQFLVSNGLIY